MTSLTRTATFVMVSALPTLVAAALRASFAAAVASAEAAAASSTAAATAVTITTTIPPGPGTTEGAGPIAAAVAKVEATKILVATAAEKAIIAAAKSEVAAAEVAAIARAIEETAKAAADVTSSTAIASSPTTNSVVDVTATQTDLPVTTHSAPSRTVKVRETASAEKTPTIEAKSDDAIAVSMASVSVTSAVETVTYIAATAADRAKKTAEAATATALATNAAATAALAATQIACTAADAAAKAAGCSEGATTKIAATATAIKRAAAAATAAESAATEMYGENRAATDTRLACLTSNVVTTTAAAATTADDAMADSANAVSAVKFTNTATKAAAAATVKATEAAQTAVEEAANALAAAMSATAATEQAAIAAAAATERAEALSQIKSQFIAALSHELRAPLSPIMLIIDELLAAVPPPPSSPPPPLAPDISSRLTTASATAIECADRIIPVQVPPDIANDLGTIRDCITMEIALVDDLLDITRIAAGKLHLTCTTLDVHELLTDIIKACQTTSNDVVIRADLGAARPCCVGDATRLKQVFWNVLRNAVKFTPRGGTITVTTFNRPKLQPPLPTAIVMSATTVSPVVVNVGLATAAGPTREIARTAATLAARMGMVAAPRTAALETETGTIGESELVIVVSDTGIGMSAEQLKRLFLMFGQGGSYITRQFGGLGLGLNIASAIMTLHSGTIVAYSAGMNTGAAFTMTMDSVEPPSSEESATQQHCTGRQYGVSHYGKVSDRVPPSVDFAALRVLLVEDNAMTLRLMQRTLSRFGIGHVYTATTVHGSIQIMQQLVQLPEQLLPPYGTTDRAPLDLLISDISLPDGSGLEVMTAARRLCEGVRGIACSGYGTAADIASSLAVGFHSHLVKPITPTDLRSAIIAALAAHEGS